MRSALLATSRAKLVDARPRLNNHAVPVPGAVAIVCRPNPVNTHGQSQTLVVCHHGICPLHLSDNHEQIELGAPLALRNHLATGFNVRHVHDAAYDSFSGLVTLASGTRLLGLDNRNQLMQLAGDEEGGLLYDGTARDARFVGAQRLATSGCGTTYIRDRDSSSKNGFCLRAVHETPLPIDPASFPSHASAPSMPALRTGSGHRAVVTVQTGSDTGPHILAYDTRRRCLLFARRGRAIHRLLPLGATEELIGTDEPPRYNAATSALEAAASASDRSATSSVDTSELDISTTVAVAEDKIFVNIQSLAADSATGNVYILDGTAGSTTALRVLRPDGSLDTLEPRLRVGPVGSSKWPRLAVLPLGYLAVFGTSQHDILLVKP